MWRMADTTPQFRITLREIPQGGNQPQDCNSTLLLLSIGRKIFASSRDNTAFPWHAVLTSSAKTQGFLQSPCFSANVFVRVLVLQIMDLQRGLFFLSGTLKGKNPWMGRRIKWLLCVYGCLLPTDCATVLEARFQNYTVLTITHN